jgi:hypothetical protein
MKIWCARSLLTRLLVLVITVECLPSRIVWISAQEPPSSALLEIVIVGGDGAINNVKKRTSREPIVEVRDENHKPVAGAIVSFTLPNVGPGGTFANGKLLMVTTDQTGRAAATSFRANSETGSFNIRVTASFQGRVATATITQTNAIAAAAAGAAAGGLFGIGIPATLAIVGAAVAGAAFGIHAAVSSSGPSNAVKISVGTPTLP